MDEYVFAAFFWLNEAESLGFVVKFYGTRCHDSIFTSSLHEERIIAFQIFEIGEFSACKTICDGGAEQAFVKYRDLELGTNYDANKTGDEIRK